MSKEDTPVKLGPPTITIREFKMWLAGVEEIQPDGWSPDAMQWAKIRERIQMIDDTIPVAYPQAPAPASYANVPGNFVPVNASGYVSIDPTMPVQPAGPSSLAVPTMPTGGIPRQGTTASGIPVQVSHRQADASSIFNGKTPNSNDSGTRFTFA